MTILCQELANEHRDLSVRIAAGISVKNCLVSKNEERRNRQVDRWCKLDSTNRNHIKQLALSSLKCNNNQVGTAGAQVVAAIASVELPIGYWPDLMNELLKNCTGNEKSVFLRKSTLEAIGFLCEQIDPAILENQSSAILTAVVNGLRKEESSMSVRVAAAKALLNSVDFIRRHFDNEAESSFIMQVVCEATTSADENLVVASFEVLIEIIRVFYGKMGPFIGAGVAQMVISILKSSSSDPILLQAIEFWSSLAEIERDLEDGLLADDASRSYYFVRRFTESLLPALLSLFKQQLSEDCTDEWCPSMAASTCLGLISEALRDNILEGSNGSYLSNYVRTHLDENSWRARDSAIMALGSVLDGPDSAIAAPFIRDNLNRLVELLANDSSVSVQDSAAWAIGRICDFHLEAVPENMIPFILQALIHCLAYPPRVSVNCCWSLMTLCIHLGAEDDSVPSSPVSILFESLTRALLNVADRLDADENNLRLAAYQSIGAVSLNAPSDCYKLVESLQEEILSRLEQALTMTKTSVVNADDRNKLAEILANLCSILQSTIRKLGSPSTAAADRIMTVLLTLLPTSPSQNDNMSSELEDVLLLIGVLASECGQEFLRFVTYLIQPLSVCLGKFDEASICSVSVGVCGDLARSLGALLLPHSDVLMSQLVAGLHSPLLNRLVKPHIIGAIGDIALAIGPAFSKYSDSIFPLLLQAAAIQPIDTNDFDEIDFILSLREALLETFTCLVQGLRDDPSSRDMILKYMPQIIAFLHSSANDDERSELMIRSVAGLLGDIFDTYRADVAPLVREAWVSSFLSSPLPHSSSISLSPQTLSVLQWARQIIFS